MVTKSISSVALTEFVGKHTDGVLPLLVEVYSPEIVWDKDDKEQENGYLRLVSDICAVKYKKSTDSKAHTYSPCCMTFKPVSVDGKEIGTASISISALDNRIVQIIRSITIKLQITIVASFMKKEKVKDGQTKALYYFVPLESTTFTANSVTWDKTAANFQLVFDEALKLQVPKIKATQKRFPACYDED